MPGPTIAISGMGAMQPGLPIVRALRATPGFSGSFVALSYNPLDPANFESSLVERAYLMPYPSMGADQVLDRLQEIYREGPFQMLLSTLDSELPIFIQIAPELERMGVRTLLPTQEQLAARSKIRLPELAELTGIAVPRTRVCHSVDAAYRAAKDLGYPVVVKGQFYGAIHAHSDVQMEQALNRLVGGWGLPVIVQEMLHGMEYDVIVLGGRDGELLGAVPMKKLQLDEQGKAWGGVTVADPALDELVASAMSGLRWRGMCELELMRNDRDGRFYLIEINPRTPAWVALSVVAGQNLPHALVRLTMGEDVAPMREYTVGAMVVRQVFDVASPIGVYESMVTGGKVDHVRKPPGPSVAVPRRTPGMGGPGEE